MGTWATPTLKQAKAVINIINSLKTLLYQVVGDDIFFDSLDDATERINELVKKSGIKKPV